jgi:hypothetical protein
VDRCVGVWQQVVGLANSKAVVHSLTLLLEAHRRDPAHREACSPSPHPHCGAGMAQPAGADGSRRAEGSRRDFGGIFTPSENSTKTQCSQRWPDYPKLPTWLLMLGSCSHPSWCLGYDQVLTASSHKLFSRPGYVLFMLLRS